jgi:hypothetical protein
VYHEDGLAAAQEVWEEAMRTDYAAPGRLRTTALNTRRSFNQYVRWDEEDGRAFADREITAEIDVGANVLAATVDVVVLDPAGVSGRIVLWDLYGCSGEESGVLAAPACRALEAVYGDDRVPSVEVWDLRGGQRWEVSREVARSYDDRAALTLERIARS